MGLLEMKTFNHFRFMIKLIKPLKYHKSFIHHRCTHVLNGNQVNPYRLSFYTQKLRFSELLNENSIKPLNNCDKPTFNENEINSESKIGSGSSIDVDEELQRYSYEEFEEFEKEEVVKVAPPRPFLKRGIEGVFDCNEIEKLLISEKMDEVVVIEVPPDRNFCSQMLIASARSKRQLNAVAEKIRVMYKLKRSEGDGVCIKLEGSSDDWLAIDLENLIVHLMMPKVREKYRLDRLWGDEDDDKDDDALVGEGSGFEEFSFDEELKKVKKLRREIDG